MADLVAHLATKEGQLHGLWHVASTPINKYDLLDLINRYFGLGIDLVRDDKFHMDRRLDGARFHAQTGFSAPDWESMIAELRADPTPYDE
jgi:dTDP-4-dehydrorhamnose reductase